MRKVCSSLTTVASTTMVDLQYIFMFLLLWLFSAFFFVRSFFKKRNKFSENALHLPPSPPALPLIGHLHYLSSLASHKPLEKLSSKHGPLLYLHFFNYPIVVVSSPSVARDVYKTQDINFSSRAFFAIDNSLLFGPYSFISAPYGEYWKFMKKFVMTELLGLQHLGRSRDIRGEELERFYFSLLEKARRREAFDVFKEMMKFTNNSICRMAMGTGCSGEDDEAEKVQNLVIETFNMVKKIFIANALHPLKKLGISLFQREIMDLSHRFDVLLEKILKEHEVNPNREPKDMMDMLLEAHRDEKAEYKVTRNHIKGFLLELFVAGTDTSAQTTQWIMAELMNHPDIFKKVREEIDSVVGRRRHVRETDLRRLPYLQAVVKEGLRLHPPVTVLGRKCQEGCTIGGFDVPENVMLVVNVYAIMRDPSVWESPEEFRPERFLGSESRGEEGMSYIPFGGGRRGCPGTNLAYIFMGTTIGTMVQCFDWQINGNDDVNKVNMEETGDIALKMAYPLNCTPLLRSDPIPSSS